LLGWDVIGIWPGGSDGTDVNACAVNSTRTLLVTVDDLGSVKLFRFPAVGDGVQFKRFNGHCSHIPSCVFTPSDDRVVTAGGRCSSP